jgi:hypothetical protein
MLRDERTSGQPRLAEVGLQAVRRHPRKGGQFADLHKQRLTYERYARHWFCEDCEDILDKTEDYAARLLDIMARNPKKEQPYDERPLPFITSISWRSLKLHVPRENPRAVEGRWDEARIWRWYLLGNLGGIKSYTQHDPDPSVVP